MMQQAIGQLVKGQHLSLEQARDVFECIMSGQATDAQIGGYLVAQTLLGESLNEIRGAVEVMRSKATSIPCQSSNLVDIVGTGGDHSGSFNISTASAIVASGAGVRIAKHGNRSVTSRSGAADALKSLGVNIEITPELVAECVDQIGIGFLYAPLLHGAMKYAIGPRRELGLRTIFNLLGPLTNPAGAKRQVMGVYAKEYLEDLAQVLLSTGSEHVWLVRGQDGLDEISLCVPSDVVEGKDGVLHRFELDPRKYGFELCSPEDLRVDGPEQSAELILSILKGQVGAPRDVVVLNSAAAIYVSGVVDSYEKALIKAQESIDSGAALNQLTLLVQKTQVVA
jgi:anthranilate phosphoribosyltransferase